MRFFRRGGGDEPVDFWTWWSSGGRDRLAAAIEGDGFDDGLIAEISRAVRSIHPAMAWELAPGRTAKHAFCISPEGNAELRPLALRWLETTPPADVVWEFHASRQASTTLATLEVGGASFDLGAMRAITSWDATRRRVDVRLWNPGFETAPEEAHLQAGFLFLDNLLGEDDVERWIGRVDLLDLPISGRTPDELRAEIARRAEEPAEDTWILGELPGRSGNTTIVVADAALKRIDHPFAAHHVSITVVLDGPTGLPDDQEAAALNAEEDDLVARLEGTAVYAGRTTTPGERTMHFVAEDPELMRPAIDAWGLDLPPRRIRVSFEHDPGWTFRESLGLG